MGLRFCRPATPLTRRSRPDAPVSYHTVSIDAQECTLFCKDGQLSCRTQEGEQRLPLDDVSAIVVTSFSASLHSSLLIEAAKRKVALILCEKFRPVALLLPANRATDTLLTRAQAGMSKQLSRRLWQKTIDAKCRNQLLLATELAPGHPRLPRMTEIAIGRSESKEARCARHFWRIFSEHVARDSGFRRRRERKGLNPLLNYGYAVLLSSLLQNLLAVGLDPTFGISHVVRERATPLAYDLMEPFRACVDARISAWVRQNPGIEQWEVDHPFRRFASAFLLERIPWDGQLLPVRGVVEAVARSFRESVVSSKSGPYQPWTRTNTKWDG